MTESLLRLLEDCLLQPSKANRGLEKFRLFKTNHTIHGKLPNGMAVGSYSLHTLVVKNDGPTEALTRF